MCPFAFVLPFSHKAFLFGFRAKGHFAKMCTPRTSVHFGEMGSGHALNVCSEAIMS